MFDKVGQAAFLRMALTPYYWMRNSTAIQWRPDRLNNIFDMDFGCKFMTNPRYRCGNIRRELSNIQEKQP